MSHHLMANRWGNSGNSDDFIFLGSKIPADGDCSHEIKRYLLLGRKVMTNLDSILKSRDITLMTKCTSQSYGFSKSHVQMWADAAKSRQSCPTLRDPIDSSPPGSCPWDSPGKSTGVGCHCLLQQMWEVEIKKAERQRIDAFELWCW